MAEKQIYPMISEKSWWLLRNQFKKTIPSIVNVSYLKSLLSLNSDQSARNILAPLKQMGLIDNDGKPLQKAIDWRSDAKYPEVCASIISELYPTELNDLFPDSEIDPLTAKSWFMDTCAIGDNAAQKIMSTYALLKNGQVKSDIDFSKTTQTTKIPTKPKQSKTQNGNKKNDDLPPLNIPNSNANVNTSYVPSSNPTLHIDLQIHISPDASPDQIDSIFKSMSKHLYGKN